MVHHRSARTLLVALLVTVAALASAGRILDTPLLAAQPPATSAQDEFVPVKDLPAQEQMPAAPLLIAAYAFVWVMLIGYLWSVWRRLGAVERDLEQVSRRLEDVRRS